MTVETDLNTIQQQKLTYDVTGKVTEVRDETDNLQVSFVYDDRGFRLMKKDHTEDKETWYIRDASGSIMAVYDRYATDNLTP